MVKKIGQTGVHGHLTKRVRVLTVRNVFTHDFDQHTKFKPIYIISLFLTPCHSLNKVGDFVPRTENQSVHTRKSSNRLSWKKVQAPQQSPHFRHAFYRCKRKTLTTVWWVWAKSPQNITFPCSVFRAKLPFSNWF